MALTPEIEFEDLEDASEAIETSQTYRIDFENNRINGLDAIRQFVYIALHTEWYSYSVFSHDIGNELQEVLSDQNTTDAYKKMEIPRLIEEALLYDDRILAVTNFEIEKKDDAFIVSFIVETDEGMLEIEEVLGEDV